jgi:hypothetical protein
MNPSGNGYQGIVIIRYTVVPQTVSVSHS